MLSWNYKPTKHLMLSKIFLNDKEKLLMKASAICESLGLEGFLDPLELYSGELPANSSNSKRQDKVLFCKQYGFYMFRLGYLGYKENVSSVSRTHMKQSHFLKHLKSLMEETYHIRNSLSREPEKFDSLKYFIVRYSDLCVKSSEDAPYVYKFNMLTPIFSPEGTKKLVELIDDGESLETIIRVFRYSLESKADIDSIRNMPESWVSALHPES